MRHKKFTIINGRIVGIDPDKKVPKHCKIKKPKEIVHQYNKNRRISLKLTKENKKYYRPFIERSIRMEKRKNKEICFMKNYNQDDSELEI